MPNKIALPETAKKLLLTSLIEDDFCGLNTAVWTAIAGDDNASVAIDADGVNGVVQFIITTDDNEEAYLHSLEVAKIQTGKSILALARVNWAEAATDDANVIVGLMDAWAANQLVDDGAGPKTTFDGACFYKVDGENRWHFRSSNATAYTDTELDVTAGGGYQTLGIEIIPQENGYAEVIPWIDPLGGNNLVQPREYGAHAVLPGVKHEVALSGMAEIALGFGVKNGGANSETLNLDLACLYQSR